MAVVLTGDYPGCYGDVRLGRPVTYECRPYGERLSRPGDVAVQWTRAGASGVPAPPVDGAGRHLTLSGVLHGPVTRSWTRRVIEALESGHDDELAAVPGPLAGCLVTTDKVFLFRNAVAPEGLLYRREGSRVRWSTDPLDLLDGTPDDLDEQALWRCCRGDDVFVYRQPRPVGPGELVVMDTRSTTRRVFDRITPLELPRRTPLAEYADLAHRMLLDAVRPYAGRGRIGIMLSGGLDSSAVLTALVEVGADVVAYHMHTDDPLADESAYARTVCDHLGVPFVAVPTESGEGYLSRARPFPHPFVGFAYRWVEQLAERVHEDGITFLTWGADGDLCFGPYRYGLHDVLFGDIAPHEKAALCRGLIASRWELSRVLRSVRRSSSLLEEYLPVGVNARPTEFTTPAPGVPDDRYDSDYSAKEHTMDLMLWWPRGILRCSPLGDRQIKRLTARMPHAYRLLVHQGRMIPKPVLRLLLSTRLPATVWRRYGRLWQDSPHKRYAITHPHVFADLIGTPQSQLVTKGIVDPDRLAAVLAEPASLRRHSETLICAAMTELFLRDHAALISEGGTYADTATG
ncbi:unnamed protein product [[Actinomadura] parvosata subsp. kistnae]|uniref:asparagine synthase-related protein n=1 Tax=[Actinomadura] parvosata TaxID=1955412 RepID=UPI000D29B504|nr:unnamed protein product [Actinomadura parvosata subsp. kistnae]